MQKETVVTFENKRKFFLSQFSYFDGKYKITFNIIDMNFESAHYHRYQSLRGYQSGHL